MKIIGHTKYGYLIEIAPEEIAKITGNPDDNSHSSHYYGRSENHSIGTEFHVSKTWDHLQRLLKNESERKSIAEALRAAATLVELTPSPLTLPAQDEASEKETKA